MARRGHGVAVTRRIRKGERTAGELMAELRQDPEFVARERQRDEEMRRNLERYRLAARGVLSDLAEIGYQLSAVQDLRRLGRPYPDAVPVLVRWLPVVTYDALKDDIVRTLSVPWAKSALPALFSELVEIDDPTDPTGVKLRWVIGSAIEILADDAVFEPVASLVRDPKHGRAREMLTLALAKMKNPEAVPVLIELLGDPTTAVSALQALAKLRARVPAARVEPFLSHRDSWVRKQAKIVMSRAQ